MFAGVIWKRESHGKMDSLRCGHSHVIAFVEHITCSIKAIKIQVAPLNMLALWRRSQPSHYQLRDNANSDKRERQESHKETAWALISLPYLGDFSYM